MYKVYYARCMSLYGTKQEKRDIMTLNSMVNDVEIIQFPSQALIDETVLASIDAPIMSMFFFPLVNTADLLAFRSLPDGGISAGVASEIEYAQQIGVPVVELLRFHGRPRLSVEETRQYLREVGQR